MGGAEKREGKRGGAEEGEVGVVVGRNYLSLNDPLRINQTNG